MAGMLSITFRGPFVFSVNTKSVDVYAPKCNNHLAGIFWTDGEFAIEGINQCGDNHTYSISSPGIASNVGNIAVVVSGGGKLLKVPPKTTPQLQYAYFHLSVPRPKLIYGMNTDTVEVVIPPKGPQGTPDDFATGLRFYYDWDITQPVSLTLPCYPPPAQTSSGPSPKPITPPVGAPLPDYGDIEIQYDGPNSADPDHLDAIDCFNQLANLAGLTWWLTYYNPGGGGSHIRTGSDCKATPLIIGI